MDSETYLTADECLKYGLCTKVVEDSEETEDIASEAVDNISKMFADRLKQLEVIKNALKDFDSKVTDDEGETDKPETVKEPDEKSEETVKESIDPVKEPTPEGNVEKTDERKEETLNELQRFFHVKKGVNIE